MDELKPTLQQAIGVILDRLDAVFPDVNSQDLLTLILFSGPVWQKIARQAHLIYYLISEEEEEDTDKATGGDEMLKTLWGAIKE